VYSFTQPGKCSMNLPVFSYHPDPFKTDTFIPSDQACRVCNQCRGFQYMGPVYPNLGNLIPLCPWCIASGEAHSALDLEFSDPNLILKDQNDQEVSRAVKDEICQRTPGFNTWQDQIWLSHCADAAVFLGACDGKTIRQEHAEVIPQIQENYCGEHEDLDEYVDELEAEGGWLVARIFQCRHCSQKLVHIEAD